MNIQNILGYGSFAGISTMFIHEAYQKIHTIDSEKEKHSSLKKMALNNFSTGFQGFLFY